MPFLRMYPSLQRLTDVSKPMRFLPSEHVPRSNNGSILIALIKIYRYLYCVIISLDSITIGKYCDKTIFEKHYEIHKHNYWYS